MKVFIAGHRGLVGSALVRTKPHQYEIVTKDRNELDLSDSKKVKIFLEYEKPNAVIVAAARVGGIHANASNQRNFLIDNLRLQDSLMQAALETGIRNLIFLGSSCVYPRLASQPIKEESLLTGELEPTNQGYALAKIAGIQLCKFISEEYGFNYFSLMPTNLFGPNDNFDLQSSHVPAAFIRKFHEAKLNKVDEISIWGTGSAMREFMHADDLAKACWHLLPSFHGGELINVGSGFEMSILDFARLVAKVIGYEGTILNDPTKPDGTPRKLLDSSRINEYGWKCSIELEVGIRQTYEWYLSNLEKGTIRGIET